MTEPRPALDETKLAMVRTFLRERFRAWNVTDRFDFDGTAQRFAIGAGTPNMHILIVPKGTLDDIDLVFLLNDDLIEVLKLAGAVPVTLTTKGPRY